MRSRQQIQRYGERCSWSALHRRFRGESNATVHHALQPDRSRRYSPSYDAQSFRQRLFANVSSASFCLLFGIVVGLVPPDLQAASGSSNNLGLDSVDAQLASMLNRLKFTGSIESTLEQRLGRKLDQRLAQVGQMLWFDTITGLHVT